jgi:hypothetical protein
MRLHLRLMALCTVAVLAAGCANHDSTTTSSPVAGATNRITAPTAGECTTTIGNRVWYDVNCNGLQDKDETGGPEGVKVTLLNCDTQQIYGTATDSNGFWNIILPAGDNQICIEIPGGFAASIEDVNGNSNDELDSDINTEGCTACRTYGCDETNNSRDAGLCEKKGDEGSEGCTPGFWRNHLTWWATTPYSPSDKVNDTFGCDLVSDDNLTLGTVIDAPQTYGVLAFHAIAALLNSTCPDVDFGLSADEVKDLACAGDKSTLSTENEKGCPLSGGNTTGGGPKPKK